MSKNIGSKTKSSLIWNTSARIGNQVVQFVISIIIARILDPKDFGIMGIATMIVFYANSITNFGFNNALIQKKEITENHIYSVFTIDIIISLFLTAITILLSVYIGDFFHTPELKYVLWTLSPIFIITSFSQMPQTLMQREVNFKIIAITDLLRGAVQSLTTLTLAFLGFGYWSLVIGLVVSNLFAAVYINLKVNWMPRIKYSHKDMKDIFKFGIYNFVRAQIAYMNEFADKFIIGKFLGTTFLGFYEKAYSTVAMQKHSFSMHFNAVMFSSFSRIQSEKHDQIKEYFKKAVSITSLITLPINAGLFLLGDYFVLVLLGSKWEPMIIPLKILTIAFVFVPINGLIASLNIGRNNYVKQTIREAYCNIFLIFVCFILVQKGIDFVAIGIVFSYFFMFITTFQITVKDINIGIFDMFESLRPAVLSTVVMIMVVLLAQKFLLSEINAFNFVMLSGIGVFVYIVTALAPHYSILEDFQNTVISSIHNVIKKILTKQLE